MVKSQTAKFFLQDMSLTYLKRINGKQKTAAFFGKKKPMKLIVSDTSGSQHKAPQYHIRFNVLTKLELDSIERSCKDKKTHIWVHKSSTGS